MKYANDEQSWREKFVLVVWIGRDGEWSVFWMGWLERKEGSRAGGQMGRVNPLGRDVYAWEQIFNLAASYTRRAEGSFKGR